MDEEAVRARAQAVCEALVAGDIDRAATDFSQELRKKLGEVVGLLPLPASQATVESVEHAGSGFAVVIRLVGETEEVAIQTRWKERDGKPTMIEAGHLSRKEAAPPAGGEGEPAAAEADDAGGGPG